MITCKKLLGLTNVGRALVQDKGLSGVQQDKEEKFVRQDGEQGTGTSIYQLVSAGPTSSCPPQPSQDNWSQFKKSMDKLLCIEAKGKKNHREN